MPRPRDPSKKNARIYSSRYAHGHVEPIGGVAYIRLPDGTRRSTGLRWGPSTADDCRTLLDKALEAFHANGRVGRAVTVSPTAVINEAAMPRTRLAVYELIKEFKDLALADATVKLRADHQAARRHYLDPSLPMDAAAIERHLLERNATSPLSAGTRRGYLMRLRQMFAWAVKRGMLDRNPVDAVPPPKYRRGKIPGYTTEEVEKIVAYFAERRASPPTTPQPAAARTVRRRTPPVRVRRSHWHDYELAVRLQALTAMRSAELLGLKRDDIGTDAIRIRGKGGRVRLFPLTIPADLERRAKGRGPAARIAAARLTWLRDIRDVIDTLMSREPIPGGWLFRVRDRSRYRDHLHDAKAAKGIPADERVSHAIRKWALWHWREVLWLDADVRAELAGHAKDIADDYYNRARTASEAMRAIVLSRL